VEVRRSSLFCLECLHGVSPVSSVSARFYKVLIPLEVFRTGEQMTDKSHVNLRVFQYSGRRRVAREEGSWEPVPGDIAKA
jgi:hypothetical protein